MIYEEEMMISIFAKNLPDGVVEDDIREVFEVIGMLYHLLYRNMVKFVKSRCSQKRDILL